MKEVFNKPYVAIPIKESPLLAWLKTINRDAHFFHMSLFFLGKMNETELAALKAVLENDLNIANGINLEPLRVELFGVHQKTQVLKLKPIEGAEALFSALSEKFPAHSSLNLPFDPHITIKKYDHVSIPPMNVSLPELETYRARSVGIYYRTEEGATALLYSRRI